MATGMTPISERIMRFADNGDLVLLGSRCVRCSTYDFPANDGCARCAASDSVDVDLGTEGTLWTWTVQGFAPKNPPYLGPVGDDFEPFGVGYVEIDGQLRVEGRLTVCDPDLLVIGMRMRLVPHPLFVDDHGECVVTYAFAPVGVDSGGHDE